MTALRAAVARLFFAGLPGRGLDRGTRRLHRGTPFGGVVLFRRNAGTPRAMRALVRALHALDAARLPLVAIDHEGGRVHRLAPPFTHFPAAATVTAHGPTAVRAAATAMGRELAALDLDLSFAPVLDVATNPANPVIGDRAHAGTAAGAARAGVAVHRALRACGLVTCGKHFPGHGDTLLDSHLALPIVRRSRRRLGAVELVPFRRAIAAGIPMLMTAHVRYPALDSRRPATLSPAIVSGLLRGRLGFRGAVCSDDLHMRAIADHRDLGEAAVAALAAGVDLLLVCQEQEALAAGVDAVVRAVERGRLPMERILDAGRRLEAVARWRRRHRQRVPLTAIGCAAHRDLAARLRATPARVR